MRLIDADALVLWAKKFYPNNPQFASAIENAPTMNQVQHGCWEPFNELAVHATYMGWECTGWECSLCHKSITYGEEITLDLLPNYCPNCGAKMDGEERK